VFSKGPLRGIEEKTSDDSFLKRRVV